MRKVIIALLIVTTLLLITGCESFKRNVKSLKSDFGGGLNRVINVYSYDAKLLKQYKGNIDIEESEGGGKVKFDFNGKRYIIYNAIVIVEEK